MEQTLPEELPADLRGFNWGAFFLQWIWGIRHKVAWAWLALIPGVNIIIAFMLGFRGNELAWKNCKWESEVEFDLVEREWTMWGIGITIVGLLIFGLIFLQFAATETIYDMTWRQYRPEDLKAIISLF